MIKILNDAHCRYNHVMDKILDFS